MHWFLILFIGGYSATQVPMASMDACIKARDSYKGAKWTRQAFCVSDTGDYLEEGK